MIIAKFNDELGILESTFSGEISQQEIYDYVLSLRDKQFSYPKKLKILSDATDVTMKFSQETLSEIIAVVKKHPGMYESVFDAMVLSSPRETAISVLFEEFASSGTYNFKVFSSRSAALEWLELH